MHAHVLLCACRRRRRSWLRKMRCLSVARRLSKSFSSRLQLTRCVPTYAEPCVYTCAHRRARHAHRTHTAHAHCTRAHANTHKHTHTHTFTYITQTQDELQKFAQLRRDVEDGLIGPEKLDAANREVCVCARAFSNFTTTHTHTHTHTHTNCLLKPSTQRARTNR